MLLANILSAIGAILLTLGYFVLTVKKKEKPCMILSGMGSFVMCFAFYLFESHSFLLLNVIWTVISIYGVLNRSNSKFKIDFESKLIHPTLLIIYSYGIYALIVAGINAESFSSVGKLSKEWFDVVSWVSISIMVLAYVLFSLESIERKHYIIYSLLANLICIPYMFVIFNYSSVVHTIVGILLSGYSLFYIFRDELAAALENI